LKRPTAWDHFVNVALPSTRAIDPQSQQWSAKKIPLFILFDQFLSLQKRTGSPFKNISKK